MYSGATIPQHRLPHDDNNGNSNIVEGSGNPNNEVFYNPSLLAIKQGNNVVWINNDSLPHTATPGNPDNQEAAPPRTLFDKVYLVLDREVKQLLSILTPEYTTITAHYILI